MTPDRLTVTIYNDPASYVELVLGNDVEKHLRKNTQYTPLRYLR